MSKLIQLRQRIKAIETIKKITHAMRLIAMSSHSHLKNMQKPLAQYRSLITTLFSRVHAYAPTWHHAHVHSTDPVAPTLIILIGSQKGLCGGFNTNLFRAFETHAKSYHTQPYEVIAVGQKAIDFMNEHHRKALIHSYEKFGAQRLQTIAHEITHSIMYKQTPYSTVTIVSNVSKGFFSQRATISTIIPLESTTAEKESTTDYLWEQTPAELLDVLITQYIESTIYSALFESLVAEHAARFLSMDTATRNANDLLIDTRLEFNKQRQTKITKEITELSSSY